MPRLQFGQHIAAVDNLVFSHRDQANISGLSSAIKAEKRAQLAERLAEVMDLHVETDLRIGRAEKSNKKGRGASE